MKIGIDGSCLQGEITGMGRVLKNILLELAKIDDKNTYDVFFNSSGVPGFFPSQKNIQAKIVKSAFKKRFLWQNLGLAQEINKGNYDIFHFYFYTLPFTIKDKKVKLITTIADVSYEVNPEWYTFFSRMSFRSFSKLAVKKSSAIITISEFSKSEIKRVYGVPEEKIKVITLAAEFHSEGNTGEVKRKYSLPDKFVLYVGSVTERKNILRLLKAFSMLIKEKNINESLVLAGSYFKPCLDFHGTIDDLGLKGRVFHFGYIPENELPAFYKLSRCVVYPSLYEGFGLPILEAMAYGIPVTASNIPAIKEVAGEAAVLFNPLDIGHISGSIFELLTNEELRKNCINTGYKRVKAFSWETAALSTLELYNKIGIDT